jgi:Flp pilus assembly protein TadG
MNKQTKSFLEKRQKGQILVLLALMFIGLIAVVGLATDLGMYYVSYSRLNRAVDAAALAASSEFRRNYTIAEMRSSASQFLNLNEVNTANTTEITVDTCDSKPSDTELCTTPRRKLVRITVKQTVPMYFLTVIGIPSASVEARATSEAASLDVMLVLDNSTSMTENAPRADGLKVRDPKICNEADQYGNDTTTPSYDGTYTTGPDGLPGECHPFEEVKWATLSFVNQLNFKYDRMGIVVFNRMPHIGETIGATGYPGIPLTGNVADDPGTPGNETNAVVLQVQDAVKALKVYEGSGKCAWDTSNKSAVDPVSGLPLFPNSDQEPCRLYKNDGITYWAMDCPNTNQAPYDVSRCTMSNIGGGLALAGNALGGAYGVLAPYMPYTPVVRKESVWVIILVSDGNANAGYNPDAICPSYTWTRKPQCRDQNPYNHRDSSDPNYDPDDYARDMADIVVGNSVYIFSIGLGTKLDVRDDGSTAVWNTCDASQTCAPGQELLHYIAEESAMQKAETKNFKGTFYDVGTNADALERVFLDIYNKLTTKLTR